MHVDVVAGAGNRARAERQLVDVVEESLEPGMVSNERRGMSEKEVRGQNRLRPAQMGVGRHQRVARALGARRQNLDDCDDGPLNLRDAPLEVEPEVDRDLFVARPARMEPTTGVANARDELPLDKRVHVFVFLRLGRIEERLVACRATSTSCRPASMAAASAGLNTPARASAAAHARLPRTSSSNRRRSKPNERPNATSAASGFPSKRPDHKCATDTALRMDCDVGWPGCASVRGWR